MYSMQATDIAFPNIGIYLSNVPKTINIFGFDVALYGIIIAFGMLMGFTLAGYVAKKEGMKTELVWDFAAPAIVFSICGARIYYVATSWDRYKDNPVSIFYLREGGLAIYGGVIAAFITLYVYTRIKKVSFGALGDVLIAGLPLGQAIGRWGNFFNREAFGGYCNAFTAMKLPVNAVRARDISEGIRANMEAGADYILVHPTFLYESMYNLLLVIFLLWYRKKKHFDGEVFLLYVVCYGIGRFFIESLRTDQLFIPGTVIPISMALGLLSAVAALVLIFIYRKKLKQNNN